MQAPVFLSDDLISIGGREIRIDGQGNYERYKDDDGTLFMAKGRHQIDAYGQLARLMDAERRPHSAALEIGLFRGGSAVFLDQLFELSQLVCVDQRETPVPLLAAYSRDVPHVSAYYGVQQSNRDRLHAICETEFDDGIDLVVDDASHFYEESRTSLEVAFPFVRPGGVYVLEDWPWAHAAGQQDPAGHWADKHALTNLVFELVAIHGSDASIVASMHFVVGFAYFVRGTADLPRDGTFRLDDHLLTRGKTMPLI